MTGSRFRLPRGWRVAAIGLGFGAAATLGLGCRSTELPDSTPRMPLFTGLYPGLKGSGPLPDPVAITSANAPPVVASTRYLAPSGPGRRSAGPTSYSVAAALSQDRPAAAPDRPGDSELAVGASSRVRPVGATETSTTPPLTRPTSLYPGLKAVGPSPEPVALPSAATDEVTTGTPTEPYSPICPGLRPAGPVPYSVAAASASSWGRPATAPARPGDLDPTADPQPRVRPAAATDPATDPPLSPPGTTTDTLDLGVALRLAGVDNPTINLARERIREALADQLTARSLLLPTVNIGGNYHYHEGPLQASYGQIRNVDSQSLYLGFGARTLAAETVAFPGVRLFAHLGDAVFEPLAARQRVTTRQFDARAVQNRVLLNVSTAYLQLVGAEARLDVLRRSEADGAEVLRLTEAFAKAGQRRQADARRAAAFEDLIHRETLRAEEEVAVASARLCQLLNLDPTNRLRTPGGAVDLLRLLPEDCDIEQLVAEAVQSRPEVVARQAEVVEAQIRVRQEKVRPFVPLLSVGYSGGLFGGGSNQVTSFFGPMTGRSDFDVMAVWNIQNLGLGNVAQVRRTKAVVGETTAEFEAAVNLVRRQVVEAVAETRAAARQVGIARASLATALEGFKLGLERTKNIQESRPIELLDSFRQLLEARQALVGAIVAYDVAQFRLFVAVGSDPLTGSPAVVPMPNPGPPPGPMKQP